MTAATPFARYGARWKGARRERLRYRQELHHHLGHDPYSMVSDTAKTPYYINMLV